MNSLTQREALDVSLEDLEEHHLSLYDLCSSLDVIALRIRRAKLKAAFRLGSLYSRWEGLFPAGHVACWLTDSWRPNICLKVRHISRCFLASRHTVCSSYSCFYPVEHWISGSTVTSLQTYSGHSWDVGIGGFTKHEQRAFMSSRGSNPGPPLAQPASSLWPRPHLWIRNNGSTVPQSLHIAVKHEGP